MLVEQRRIVIVDYDSCWPTMFDVERTRLHDAVGGWVCGIEHIGSTAVPWLAAKPVIDSLVGVRALADADAHCIAPIVALDYEYISEFEKFIPERRYFRRLTEEKNHAHHIHLVEKGSNFWQRHLLFRDYLRAHPDRASQYEALKRRLAPQFSNVNDYAKAKTDFIRVTEAMARCWRSNQSI